MFKFPLEAADGTTYVILTHNECTKFRKIMVEFVKKIEEIKNKISNSLKGRTDIIYSKPQLGKPHNEETKNKISNALKGNKLKKETIEKMINTRRKYNIIQLDSEGNIVNKFNSCLEAGIFIGTSKSNINMCCKGKRKTAKGYVWKYESIN